MRRLADLSRALRGSHREGVLAGMGSRGALRIGLVLSAAGALVRGMALAGPANASPTHHNARYVFTLKQDSWPAPRVRQANRVVAYVVNSGSGTVTPISTTRNTAGPPIPTGKYPQAAATAPNGKTVHVANLNSETVTPISAATNTAGLPIPTGVTRSPWRSHRTARPST